MNIMTPPTTTTYRLLDSGNGLRLEQWGSNIIIRPDNTCLWHQKTPDLWKNASATYCKDTKDSWSWHKTATFKEPWLFSYHLPSVGQEKSQRITCQLRMGISKNIGIFPEQAAQWDWMVRQIQSVRQSPRVLNLFAYTGAATLCAAAAGAEVCHVDASKPAVSWARENQQLCKLDTSAIRLIVDDCASFVTREIKRGNTYDALIFDPPAFGRDHRGKVFSFEKHVSQLLELCMKALTPHPIFVIFNGYAMGHSATILANVLADFFPKQAAAIECGELHVAEHKGGRTLPCSIYARFGKKI
jgi:23S rRNA (cytosine1962-C5)-methyltransferase